MGKRETQLRLLRESPPNRQLWYFDCITAGCQFHTARRDVLALEEGQEMLLRRNPANDVDKNAIQVLSLGGAMFGHVPKDMARELAPLLDAGARTWVDVKKVLTQGEWPRPVLGIRVYSPDTMPDRAINQEETVAKVGLATAGGGCLTVLLVLVSPAIIWVASTI